MLIKLLKFINTEEPMGTILSLEIFINKFLHVVGRYITRVYVVQERIRDPGVYIFLHSWMAFAFELLALKR